jgi:hypothetical protein
LVAGAPAFAQQWRLFERFQFLRSAIGWHQTADLVRTKLADHHYGSILVDSREMAAELLYYLRDLDTPLHVWPLGPVPHDHYEMTRPFTAASLEPVLYVTLRRCPGRLDRSFGTTTIVSVERVTLIEAKSRLLHFCRLDDFKGTLPKGVVNGRSD